MTERITVYGTVTNEHFAATSRGKPFFINLDSAFPEQVLAVVVWEEDRQPVGPVPVKSSRSFCGTEIHSQLFRRGGFLQVAVSRAPTKSSSTTKLRLRVLQIHPKTFQENTSPASCCRRRRVEICRRFVESTLTLCLLSRRLWAAEPNRESLQ